jgi:hypothetical protein
MARLRMTPGLEALLTSRCKQVLESLVFKCSRGEIFDSAGALTLTVSFCGQQASNYLHIFYKRLHLLFSGEVIPGP